jgi:hypothetical protein
MRRALTCAVCGLVLACSRPAQGAVACQAQAGAGAHWAWRMIEHRRCWYRGRAGRPRAELAWPPAIVPLPQPRPPDAPPLESALALAFAPPAALPPVFVAVSPTPPAAKLPPPPRPPRVVQTISYRRDEVSVARLALALAALAVVLSAAMRVIHDGTIGRGHGGFGAWHSRLGRGAQPFA